MHDAQVQDGEHRGPKRHGNSQNDQPLDPTGIIHETHKRNDGERGRTLRFSTRRKLANGGVLGGLLGQRVIRCTLRRIHVQPTCPSEASHEYETGELSLQVQEVPKCG
jgi:hypothetical protein